MIFLLVSADSSIAILVDCTQKVTLFDLESPTRYSADSFCVIHEISVELINKFGHQEIWVSTQNNRSNLTMDFPLIP